MTRLLLCLAFACGGDPTAVEAPAAEVDEPVEAPPTEDPACATASDCGWDSPCVPSACLPHPTPSEECTEARPAPGTCECVAGHCALRPRADRARAAVPCSDECGVDLTRGRCAAGPATSSADVGPRCVCQEGVCQFHWVDEVPCEDAADCWIERTPFSHPVPRPAHLRETQFRPCRDGSLVPVCSEGRCTLAAAAC